MRRIFGLSKKVREATRALSGQGAIECCPGSTARSLRAQGAIESRAATAGTLRGQGATEYLVLLAVVLIIALVAVALLGFFPGTAEDTRVAENQIYWKGASPLSIEEISGAYTSTSLPDRYSHAYLQIRNNGHYKITFRWIGAEGNNTDQYQDMITPGPAKDMTSIVLAPGEAACFGTDWRPINACAEHFVLFQRSTYSAERYYIQADQVCNSDGTGSLIINDFSFGYTEYIEGSTINKTQVGAKPMMMKCKGIATPPP